MTLRLRRQFPENELIEVFPRGACSSSDAFWWWPPSYPASNALTANEDEIWNAGRFAPAGIRFTFETPITCSRIELLPCMSPKAGPVVHELRTGSNNFQIVLDASDRQWIRVDIPNGGWRFKTINLLTLESPSWVAWRRVRFWKQPV